MTINLSFFLKKAWAIGPWRNENILNIEILCGINIGNFLIRYYGHVAQEHAHNHLLSLLRNKIDSVQYENQIQIAVYVHEMAWGTA